MSVILYGYGVCHFKKVILVFNNTKMTTALARFTSNFKSEITNFYFFKGKNVFKPGHVEVTEMSSVTEEAVTLKSPLPLEGVLSIVMYFHSLIIYYHKSQLPWLEKLFFK